MAHCLGESDAHGQIISIELALSVAEMLFQLEECNESPPRRLREESGLRWRLGCPKRSETPRRHSPDLGASNELRAGVERAI